MSNSELRRITRFLISSPIRAKILLMLPILWWMRRKYSMKKTLAEKDIKGQSEIKNWSSLEGDKPLSISESIQSTGRDVRQGVVNLFFSREEWLLRDPDVYKKKFQSLRVWTRSLFWDTDSSNEVVLWRASQVSWWSKINSLKTS